VNEQEVRELFFERLQHLSAEAEYELRHPDYVMEMPQSGERIRGRDNMRAFQEAYPNPPTITPAPNGRVRRGVGDRGPLQLRRRADLPCRDDRGVPRRQDLAGHPLLRRAVPGTGVAGAVGRADGGIPSTRRAVNLGLLPSPP
jgi:hypothetical protein